MRRKMKQVKYEMEMPSFIKPYLETEEMQRLKGIDMNCGMNYTSIPFFQGIDPYTRYTHSIGAAMIIYHFTKDKKQTLSGLFHDIATPAFSHVIDFLHGDALKQESTEDKTEEILSASGEIRSRLAEDGIALSEVSNYHLYPIADNDSPMLSSDRLEYTFSASIDYRSGMAEQYQSIYDDIAVGINEYGCEELVLRHADKAEALASAALKNGMVFSSQEDRCCMQLLAELIKEAIQRKILQERDLYTTEEKVIAKLENSSMNSQWHQFQSIDHVIVSTEPKEGWIQIAAKKRYIDPYCSETGERISHTSRKIQKEIERFKEDQYQEWMKGCSKDE
jgi:HD superfamily phosphohydrolase